MSLPKFQQLFCWAALTAVAIGGGAIVLAQSDGFVAADQQPTGKIVPIAPPGGGGVISADDAPGDDDVGAPQVDLPKHWIGILLGPVPDEVRAQINVPENAGVLVRQVIPNSPAAKAGVELFDIVLSADDHPVTSGRDLMDLVQQAGASGGKITLDVLRRGEQQSVSITPEPRPEPAANDDAGTVPGPGWGFGGTMRGMPAMPYFGGTGPQFRMFAPGGAFSQRFSLSQMPNGLSVSIQKQNDEPAHITVQRGNDTWEIVGDDPKSLEQLPADVRPFVEQLLSDNSSMAFQMPAMPLAPGMMGPGMTGQGFGGFNDDEMQQQLHRMEQQLQQMRMMLQRDFAPQGQPAPQILPKLPADRTESEAN